MLRHSDTFALPRVLCPQKQTCHKKKLGCRSHRISAKLRTGVLRTYDFKEAVSHHNITIISRSRHSYKTSVRRSAHLLILSEVSLGVSQLQGKVKRSRPRPVSAVTESFNKSDFLPIANAIQTLMCSNPRWEPPSTSRNTLLFQQVRHSVKTTKHVAVGTSRATVRTTVFQSKLRGKFKMFRKSLYFWEIQISTTISATFPSK